MRWRDERRVAILTTLATEANLFRSRVDSFGIDVLSHVAPAVHYAFDCSTARLNRATLTLPVDSRVERRPLSAKAQHVLPHLNAEYHIIIIALAAKGGTFLNDALSCSSTLAAVDIHTPMSHCEGLSDRIDVVLIVVSLAMGATLKSFSFVRERRERHLFGTDPPTRVAGVGRVSIGKQPSPPPAHERASLEDRLRWILTPPIQEVLSDPQLTLPALPFAYQAFGIKWLMDRDSALLADEMGLGKTMQAILAARLLWRQQAINRVLIICPKPLISTWQDEIAKWWRSAEFNTRLPGKDRRFFLKLATDNVTIKIINYEALAKEAEWLKEQRFTHDLIIIDEAQRIKNPASKAAQAVTALHSQRRWALTGTPLENRIEDLLSIFDFVKPRLLERDDPDYVRNTIRPYLLRRRADEVLPELPEKDDQDVPVTLDGRQRDAYDTAEREGVVQLNDKGDTVTVQHVFALIKRLMQICNCEPVSGESAKIERMKGDLEEIVDSGRKVLIFSQFVAEPFGLKWLRRHLPRFCRAVEMHGEVPDRVREAAKHAFNNDGTVNTMLLHYRVGGVGLNLQAANYVYLYDRWWNPAVEDQAVKRAHRLGQDHKVFIRRLYCEDSIEERILQKLAEKRRLFSQIIEEDRPEAMGLTEEEVFALFPGLNVRPKRSTKTTIPRIVLGRLAPSQFEELVAKVYEAWGYSTTLTGGSHDGGVDIVAEKSAGNGRERVVIQCKRQRGNVGRPELQKLWGVVSADATITRGDLVTSADFTAEARGFAQGKRISLTPGDRLVGDAERLGVAKFERAVE